ncbi:MAG: Inosine-5'-monophosphate dehydrogenase [Anaerolineae bacterium]|nr:Inosine-5'-monophosphate dehydrogenase [Anaerolineae bacterium]
MQIIGEAKKVSIYIGESDKWGRKPLHAAILELLQRERCAGATVTRALSGFGAHSQIRSASLVALSADLPLKIEWIDNPARVERVMRQLRGMVTEGLITIEDVDVIFYSHRNLRHLSAFVPVQDVMTRRLNTVKAGMPLSRAVELLLNQAQKSLLVVDNEGRLIGILTDGDLLRRANLLVTSVRQHLTKAELEAELQKLQQQQTVQTVMTPEPLAISGDTTIPEAVELMLSRGVKRLPVVDDEGRPVGVVSRVDILHAFAEPLTVETPRPTPLPGQHATVREVMLTTTPAVPGSASLAEIINLLVSHVQRRVVVVDAEQRVIGIITDGDLIKRATPTERSGILQSLSRRTTPGSDAYELSQRTAAEVMTQPVVTVTPDTPLIEALNLLLKHGVKRLPVIDGQGRLVGLVGRAGILQALGGNDKG